MISLIAAKTSPKWLLVLFICSGDPNSKNDPIQDPNCKIVEQDTYSLLHCQNEQTLAFTRLPPNFHVRKSKCVEITKNKNPNIG
tara:strand:- start:226 stop:477 length:252 start_codon:yes stop_codon:yes gene_type:complete